MFQVYNTESTMENHFTQISREDLEDLREAFNRIGQFHSFIITLTRLTLTCEFIDNQSKTFITSYKVHVSATRIKVSFIAWAVKCVYFVCEECSDESMLL